MTDAAAIRQATAADVAALEAVTVANDPSATPRAGVHQPYLAHLVARGTVAVAARPDGEVVGFGASVDTGRSRHLADLFVLPPFHGQRLGAALLHAVMGDASPRTTFASDDPRALPLYVRAGMVALHPTLYLAGDPGRLACPPGFLVAPTSLDHMAELERAWAGVDRGPDLPYWASTDGARAFVVMASGREVAAGLARPRKTGAGRWVDHAVAAPDTDAAATLVAAIAAEVGLADQTGACVLGPSPLVRILLDAGFRVVGRDTYLASDPALVDPSREIVNTGIL